MQVNATRETPDASITPATVPHWGRITFFVALFLMVWPTEADILVGTLRRGQVVSASIFSALLFFGVAGSLVLSFRRRRLQPPRRHTIPYLIATGAILVLNPVLVYLTFWNELHRHI